MTRTHDATLNPMEDDPVARVQSLQLQLSTITAELQAVALALVAAPEGAREPIVDALDRRDRVALELGLAVSRCMRLGLGLPGAQAAERGAASDGGLHGDARLNEPRENDDAATPTAPPQAGDGATRDAAPKARDDDDAEAEDARAGDAAARAETAEPRTRDATEAVEQPGAVHVQATDAEVPAEAPASPEPHPTDLATHSDVGATSPTSNPAPSPDAPTPEPAAQPPSADALARLRERFQSGGSSNDDTDDKPTEVVRPAHPSHPFAKALGAPLPIRDAAEAVQTLWRGLEQMDAWLDLPRHAQRALLAYATTRARTIQARDDLVGSEAALIKAFQRMSAWSKQHEPGFVYGLRRDDTPQRGTWHDDSLHAWEALGPPPPQPERRADSAPPGLDLDALRAAANSYGEDEQVRELVAMALPHHDIGTLAEVFAGWDKRLRGHGQLKPLRKRIRARRWSSRTADLNPEVQLGKIEEFIADGRPNADLRSLIVHSLPALSATDVRLVKLVADHPAALQGEPRLRGLRKAVRRYKKKLKRTSTQAPTERPDGYPDDDWVHLGVTRGATAVVVGGDPRQHAQDRLQEAFRFAEVEWIEPSDVRKVKSLAKRISEGSVGVVILLRIFRTHTCDDLLMPALKASDTPWISVDHGYGVTQVRASMERFWER